MTEQEEKVMIAKAKAGDPKANYDMCLWALEQAEAEPGEERWKRLAAKCLVESAQAGYAPAQKKMEALVSGREEVPAPEDDQVSLDGWDEQPDSADVETPPEAPGFGAREPIADEDFWTSPLQADEGYEEPTTDDREKPDPLVSAREAVERLKAAFGHGAETPDEAEKPAPKPPRKPLLSFGKNAASPQKATPKAAPKARDPEDDEPAGFGDKVKKVLHAPTGWSDATWKKVELICGIVAVAMIILIVVLIVTGGNGGNKAGETEAPIQTLETTATPAPTIEPFPTTTVVNEINGADLDYKPLDEQYLSAVESKQVKAEGGLNLRKGPASTYESIRTLSDGLTVDVYASKADDGGTTWGLVNAGGTWGWVSMDYLQ